MNAFCKLYKYAYLILEWQLALCLHPAVKNRGYHQVPDDPFVKQLKTGKILDAKS